MSEENLEAVRSLFDAFAERDFEAAAEVLDPKVEIHPGIVGGPEGVVYHGSAGMRQFWSDVDAAWAEFRITTEQFQDLEGRILILGRAFARGRDSGITLDVPAAWIAGLRNGRIVDFRSFSSQDEALRAAGLPK
jgi:ketosteroid isomerase-like protein